MNQLFKTVSESLGDGSLVYTVTTHDGNPVWSGAICQREAENLTAALNKAWVKFCTSIPT